MRLSPARLFKSGLPALVCCLLFTGNPAPALAAAVEVQGMRVGLTPGKTRIVFDLSAPVSYRVASEADANTLVIVLEDTSAGYDVSQLPLAGTPIDQIQLEAGADGLLRYRFLLNQTVKTTHFRLRPDHGRGYRLVVDLHTGEAVEDPAIATAAATQARPAIEKRRRTTVPPTRAATKPRPPVARETGDAASYAGEWTGYISLETRLFFEDPAYPEQDEQNASVAVRPEYYADWANGRQRLSFIPFYRYDANDSKRTHADIRELYWQIDFQRFAFKAGMDVVFWGVAESQHLVDIINQTDLVENIDGEDKLGQPMLNLDYLSDLGTWQLYVLPYFRERTFPGKRGRLRNDPPVDTDDAIYESGDEEKHIDVALRWSKAIGNWDIGLAHFSGTSREAAPLPSYDKPKPRLIPFYPQIDQTSLDAQATRGAWLWKLEAIYNQNDYDNYYATVAGFEFTQFGVANSQADLGWLLEYHYDDRGDLSDNEITASALQDDLYLAHLWGFETTTPCKSI